MNSLIQPVVLTTIVLTSLASVTIAQVREQETPALVTRAQRTLSNMEHLIDLAAARQKSGTGQNQITVTAQPWTDLWDGKTMDGWARTPFGGGGDVTIDPAFQGGAPAIVVKLGATLSGINWTKTVPKTNYEISLDFMKIDGNDFVCGLTFPVADSYASLIMGGWGGGVVGISSIDNLDASENLTTRYMSFPPNKWFHVVMRVRPDKLEAFLNDKQIIDQEIVNRRINLRYGEIERSKPLGIATFQTSAAFRNVRLRQIGN